MSAMSDTTIKPDYIPFAPPVPVNDETARIVTQADFDAAMDKDYVTPTTRNDCVRIQRVAQEQLGITMSLSDAERIWRAYSSMWYITWAWIESDEEIVVAIYRFVKGKVA